MQTYTTIFIDIDNLTYELHNHKYMPRHEKEMLEQIIKKGIRSLQKFELVALLGKNEKYGKSYILRNHLEDIKMISRNVLDSDKSNTVYLEYLLKYLNRNKKEVLVVSNNCNMLNVAKSLGIDTCCFNLFNSSSLNSDADIIINKFEELLKYCAANKQNEEVTQYNNISSNYRYYIDPNVLKILKEKKITLKIQYEIDKNEFLNHLVSKKVPFAIAMDLALLEKLKKQGCITYFVNNHYNDNIDYVADYESFIEDLPEKIVKLISK